MLEVLQKIREFSPWTEFSADVALIVLAVIGAMDAIWGGFRNTHWMGTLVTRAVKKRFSRRKREWPSHAEIKSAVLSGKPIPGEAIKPNPKKIDAAGELLLRSIIYRYPYLSSDVVIGYLSEHDPVAAMTRDGFIMTDPTKNFSSLAKLILKVIPTATTVIDCRFNTAVLSIGSFRIYDTDDAAEVSGRWFLDEGHDRSHLFSEPEKKAIMDAAGKRLSEIKAAEIENQKSAVFAAIFNETQKVLSKSPMWPSIPPAQAREIQEEMARLSHKNPVATSSRIEMMSESDAIALCAGK